MDTTKRRSAPILIAVILFGLLAGTSTARTIHVSKNGNDSNDGSSWASAWRTIGKVNSSVQSGDVVFFGTGTWSDATLNPVNGTAGAYTVYACSSYVATNGSGQSHFARICGGSQLTGWTQVSGNVYQTSASFALYDGLFQGDSVLHLQTSQSGVNSPGEYYFSGGVVYAYVYGGGDPDNHEMWRASRNAIVLGGKHHIRFEGLRIQYGSPNVIIAPSPTLCDNVEFRNCHISHGHGWKNDNPALIRFARTDLDESYGFRVTSCSLGFVYPVSNDGTTYDAVNGACLDFYECREASIDSNVFYESPSAYQIYFKAGYNYVGDEVRNVLVSHNVFESNDKGFSVAQIAAYTNIDSLYIIGNVFTGTNRPIYFFWGWPDQKPNDGPGPAWIANNTFYGPDYAFVSYQASTSYELRWDTATVEYNIFVDPSGSVGLSVDADANTSNFGINRNQYYSPSGYSFVAGGSRTWSTWQSAGYDQNSVQQNPEFVNPNFGNFAPLNAVQLPTAKTWRVTGVPVTYTAAQYGAIQPDTLTTGDTLSDTTSPNGIINLSYMSPESALLAWTASEDVRVQANYGTDSAFNLSTYVTPFHESSGYMLLENLEPGQTYQASLMFVDAAGNYGETAEPIEFRLPSNVAAAFSRGGFLEGDPGQFELSWRSGGGGDPQQVIERYKVYYSLDPITEANVQFAEEVSSVPLPAPVGVNQSDTVRVDSLAGWEIYAAIVAKPVNGPDWQMVSFPTTWASGIRAPSNLTAVVDDGAAEATLSCPTVPSYLTDLAYEFQIDVSSSFNNSPIDTIVQSPGGAPSLVLGGLASGSTYFVRCRARSYGYPTPSDWSDFIVFGTGMPGGVITDGSYVFPLEGDTTGNQGPMFTIVTDSNTSFAYFQLDEDSLFRTPVASGPIKPDVNGYATWESELRLEPYADYYWRASANNVDWASPVHFYTATGIASGGTDLPSDENPVRVYPNPWRPIYDATLTFDDVPVIAGEQHFMELYTLSGQLVWSTEITQSQFTWDGMNGSDEGVASGVYFWNITDSDLSGKFIIIR